MKTIIILAFICTLILLYAEKTNEEFTKVSVIDDGFDLNDIKTMTFFTNQYTTGKRNFERIL